MVRFIPRNTVWLMAATFLGAASPVLSIKEARAKAVVRNWDLLAARAEMDQAAAQRLISKEFPNPTLVLGVSKIPTDGTTTRTSMGSGFWNRSYDSSAAVSQLLELGGKRGYRQSSALEGAKAAELRFQDARRLLDAAVIKGFVGCVLAQENEKEMARTAASLSRSADLAGIRFAAGDISLAEKLQVELAARKFEEDAMAARTAALQARITVDLLLGESHPDGNWVPKEALKELEPLLGPPKDAQPARRPDVAAAEANLRKAEAELGLQKAGRIPDLTFSVAYDHQPADQNNTIGIGVGFTLPLWNRNRGAIAAARASQRQAVTELARTEARAASEQGSAEAAFKAARHRADRYQADLLPAAEKVRASVTFAYQQGGASYLELLEAERNATDVQLAAAQACADALATAVDLATARNTSFPLDQP